MIPIELPNEDELIKFQHFLVEFRMFDPSKKIDIIESKCLHCIYNNLCDKTEVGNVYS